MPKRIIKVKYTVTAELEVEQDVLDDAQTNEWRQSFFTLSSDQEVADHIVFNLLRGTQFGSIDGFAHRENKDAVLRKVSWGTD